MKNMARNHFRTMPLFVTLLAWSAAADASAGTLSVPPVDGLGQPAAGAADAHVGFWEIVDGGVRDAKSFGDLFNAEVFSRHRFSIPRTFRKCPMRWRIRMRRTSSRSTTAWPR